MKLKFLCLPEWKQAFWYRRLVVIILLSGYALVAPAQNAQVISLSQAVDLGVRNSKNLKLAQSRIDQAISRYNQAQDSRLPTGSVSYTYNHAEILTNKLQLTPEADPFYLPKHADAAIGTAGLQEIIFAGNKLRYARESTQVLTDIARLDAEKDQEEIVYNITNAYYNLYKLQQSKKVVDQNLQAIDRQIKQAQRFFEQGIVTRNDVLRFQLQRSNVELSAVDLETNRKIVVYNLNILLGLPENTDLQTEQLPAYNRQTPALNTFMESALANRQELKSLALNGQMAELNIKSLKADVQPTVLVGANAYYLNLKGPFLPKANSFLTPLTASATIAWNFDNLWLNKNKVSEARIQKTQTDISRDLVTDQVKTEVNQNYQNYAKALERIRILETAIVQAQENDRTTASQYQNKVATATERVDAQTELFQAQINLELARADAEIAYYTLLKSTGKISQK
ncbi:TolC family protein [Adhaeribacter pallidiroseus]|uniref:Outer membrane protein TolC n=1 Tax=Adhaeribacter pallidiroseus TaxID=2072847 RepID=A0A369QET2_9BACT|nr:TolC family protein [Adhaeribacter pallidiroseus]RDC61757.1 hypothetical protein AHMF7616_00340 [Adhaeribacter pallidiroseus]